MFEIIKVRMCYDNEHLFVRKFKINIKFKSISLKIGKSIGSIRYIYIVVIIRLWR